MNKAHLSLNFIQYDFPLILDKARQHPKRSPPPAKRPLPSTGPPPALGKSQISGTVLSFRLIESPT